MSTNKKLLDFQHKNKKNYNFVIAKSKNKIISILGFIPTLKYTNQNSNLIEIWLAIWKTDLESVPPGIGYQLLKWLENYLKPRSIGAIGINPEVKKIYEVLGFTTGIMNQFFILNPNIKKYKIALPNQYDHPKIKKTSKTSLHEIKYEDMKNFQFYNYPRKSLKYIKNRYGNHPIFKYYFLGGFFNKSLKLIIIFRKIDIKNHCCLRIIDIQGDFNLIDSFYNQIVTLLEKYNAEYIDCLNYGISEKIFFQWGFSKRTSNTIIPNYFEPFERKNIDLLFAYKSKDPNYIIFKGDSDQDRPN